MKNKTIVFMFLTVAVLYLIMFRWYVVESDRTYILMIDRITGFLKESSVDYKTVYNKSWKTWEKIRAWDTTFQNAAIAHTVTAILYLALGTSLGFLIYSIKETVKDKKRGKGDN